MFILSCWWLFCHADDYFAMLVIILPYAGDYFAMLVIILSCLWLFCHAGDYFIMLIIILLCWWLLGHASDYFIMLMTILSCWWLFYHAGDYFVMLMIIFFLLVIIVKGIVVSLLPYRKYSLKTVFRQPTGNNKLLSFLFSLDFAVVFPSFWCCMLQLKCKNAVSVIPNQL